MKTIFATSSARSTSRIIGIGVTGILVLLTVTGAWLLWTLPDGNAFNQRVEDIFVANNALTAQEDIKFLEILAQSGTAFAETLASYRLVIFVLLISATALLLVCVGFLALLVTQNRRMALIEAEGIQVRSLVINRAEKLIALNDMEFTLTDAAIETLATLAEARMDGDLLTGAELESIISGKSATDCDEATGATRIKRLRDALGNQLMSAVLIRNVAKRGYILSIDKNVIRLN